MKRMIIGILCMVSLATWAGETKEVKNGMAPQGKAITYKLTEDLVIGPQDDLEGTIWAGFDTSVDVDAQGNMYVCDPAGARIIKFDASGTLVKTIGQRGQGPGEFQALKSLTVLNDGSLLAFENAQVISNQNFFSNDGAFLDKKVHQSMENIVSQALFGPSGDLAMAVVSNVDMAQKKIHNKFALVNAAYEPKDVIIEFESPLPDPSQFQSSEYWANYLGGNMRKTSKGLVGFAAFGDDGTVYTARMNTYEVTKYNKDLTPELKFTRAFKPIPMTENEMKAVVEPIQEMVASQLPPQLQQIITPQTIKKAVEIAEFPAIKNPVAGLKYSSLGHILVIHDANMETKIAKVDIFSTQGVYLGSFEHDTFGVMRMTIKNDHVYTIEERDEENHLVRYKVEVVKQ